MEGEVLLDEGEVLGVAGTEEQKAVFHQFFAGELGTGEGLQDVGAVGSVEVLSLFYARGVVFV